MSAFWNNKATHNPIYIPLDAESLQFEYRVPNASNNDRLEVSVQTIDGTAMTWGAIDLRRRPTASTCIPFPLRQAVL